MEVLLKSPAGAARWTMECASILNMPLKYIFTYIRLAYPDPIGIFTMYTSVKGDTYFAAFNQAGLDEHEHPIAFVARYLIWADST